MPSMAIRSASRRLACLTIAGMATLATVHGACAEDGIGGFLSSIFGGNNTVQQPAAASSAPVYQRSYARSPAYQRPHLRVVHFQQPLVIRPRKTTPRVVFAQSPTKPGKVSIYEDKTLRRGDAVMTADGVRIFSGSSSWPYTAGDFVALATAKDINRDTVKVLTEVDRLPRG